MQQLNFSSNSEKCQNYLSTLENEFENFLTKQRLTKNTIKNYLSDLRKFFVFCSGQDISFPFLAGDIFTPDILEKYKQTLSSKIQSEKMPVSASNRQLSTLRRFGCFLKSSGKIASDPAVNLENIYQLDDSRFQAFINNKILKRKKYLPRGAGLYSENCTSPSAQAPLGLGTKTKILIRFKQHLSDQNISKVSIKNYLSDSRQFLNWLEKNL